MVQQPWGNKEWQKYLIHPNHHPLNHPLQIPFHLPNIHPTHTSPPPTYLPTYQPTHTFSMTLILIPHPYSSPFPPTLLPYLVPSLPTRKSWNSHNLYPTLPYLQPLPTRNPKNLLLPNLSFPTQDPPDCIPHLPPRVPLQFSCPTPTPTPPSNPIEQSLYIDRSL